MNNKNIVIKNVLNNDQLINLTSIINNGIQKQDSWQEWIKDFPKNEKGEKLNTNETLFIHKKELGRIVLHNLKIPQNIIDRLTLLINESGFKGYKYSDSTSYFEYNGLFGNPKLPGHKDHTETDFTVHLDYQIKSNTDWNINVEGFDYLLKDNEGLIFMGKEQEHSRPFKKFNDGEFVNIVLFRFIKQERQT
jgi:hypothetical protein